MEEVHAQHGNTNAAELGHPAEQEPQLFAHGPAADRLGDEANGEAEHGQPAVGGLSVRRLPLQPVEQKDRAVALLLVFSGHRCA